MATYKPALRPGGLSNTAAEEVFSATLVFGAGVLTSTKGKYITGARVTNGQYKVSLPDSYRRRVSFTANWGKCAAGAVYFPVVLTDNSANTTDPHLVIETRTEAGVATDPATGNELDLVMSFSRDVLND